jgi:hypothetical protein
VQRRGPINAPVAEHDANVDADRAFAALDRAWQIKDPGLLGLKMDPTMDPLRGDQRFARLMEKLNFPA